MHSNASVSRPSRQGTEPRQSHCSYTSFCVALDVSRTTQAAAADAVSSRRLKTGRVVEIRMPSTDAQKMQAMIDLQWACLPIASMSGAADWEDFFAADDDDDDAFGARVVAEWMEVCRRGRAVRVYRSWWRQE